MVDITEIMDMLDWHFNRLFSTIQDAEQFISQYNKLVDSGENLENCGLPVVALLSTVVL